MDLNEPVGDRSRSWELTTVSPWSAVFHRGTEVARFDDLAPDTAYERNGRSFTTLPVPSGSVRSRVATVNDVHFGEVEAGRLDDSGLGPIRRALPDMTAPFPEVMNRSAVAEIAGDLVDGRGFDAVCVKGDLTDDGVPAEFAAFEACYGVFGDRLHVVRGNHDGYRGQTDYAGDRWIGLDGIAVAMLDTARAAAPGGAVGAEQLDWLDAMVAASTTPVLVLGHHPLLIDEDISFLLDADSTTAIDELAVRHPAVIAYAAGHTHRQRVVPMPRSGALAIEVGCVKDFPGTWASYEVYDGGVLQLTRRISSPEALRWSEHCRDLYSDFGVDYTEFALGPIEQRCFLIPLR